MSTRYRLLLVAASVLSVTVLPACYTLLQHPRLASLDYQRPTEKRCLNCHSSEEVWAFNHSAKQPTYASHTRAWLMYYESAWWYEKQWDYRPHAEEQRIQKEEQNDDEQ